MSRQLWTTTPKVAGEETETARLKRQEREIRGKITKFKGSARLSRDEAHRRSG